MLGCRKCDMERTLVMLRAGVAAVIGGAIAGFVAGGVLYLCYS